MKEILKYASILGWCCRTSSDDRCAKRTYTCTFGACCATTMFIPSFHNYRIWSFLGLGMTTYTTAWYLTIAALVHGQVEGATQSGPPSLVLCFTGAANIPYSFGGHAVTVGQAEKEFKVEVERQESGQVASLLC